MTDKFIKKLNCCMLLSILFQVSFWSSSFFQSVGLFLRYVIIIATGVPLNFSFSPELLHLVLVVWIYCYWWQLVSPRGKQVWSIISLITSKNQIFSLKIIPCLLISFHFSLSKKYTQEGICHFSRLIFPRK